MKATAGRPQSVGRVATAGRTQPVEHGRVSLTSSLVLSLVLHGALVLWLLGSAWLLGRAQPYRLAPQTVFLVGDSPVAIDQVLGEGGGVPAAKPDSKEPGGGKSAQVETGASTISGKICSTCGKACPTSTPTRGGKNRYCSAAEARGGEGGATAAEARGGKSGASCSYPEARSGKSGTSSSKATA